MKMVAMGGTIRTLALVFAAVMLSAVAPMHAQQPPFHPPKDGNELLEACSHAVNFLDSPSSEISSDESVLAGKLSDMTKLGWCAGYLQATRHLCEKWNIQLALLSLAGLRLSGPEKAQKVLIETFDVWIPEGVSYGQLARVLVKWLRNHPKRLH